MRIQDVLVQMESAALSTDFTKAVEAIYWEQVSADHFDETENEYEAGKTRLMALLPKDSLVSLRELEHRYAENMEYASRFSFKCGMYCAFRQFFTDNCELDGGFDSVLGKSLSTMPGMKSHSPYYENTERCLEIIHGLTDQLSEEYRMLITDVECAWENRVHNAGLLGFYIGYRAGFDLMDEVRPLSRMECISKILTMEFALGFIQPLKEQEHRQVA